ncbi:MAG: hypothetical protein ACTSP3_13375 [Candidatus Heimdallarchaeaceae archaeon]
MNKRETYSFLLISLLIWSFIFLEPNLISASSFSKVTEHKDLSKQEFKQIQAITDSTNREFYRAISEMGKLVSSSLIEAGFLTRIYYDTAIFVTTNYHLIIIGHGKLSNKGEYTIGGYSQNFVLQNAKRFEYVALLACKSENMIPTQDKLLSFDKEISTLDALKCLSEFLDIQIDTPPTLMNFTLIELDPGPGGGSGEQPGEGWVHQTASVTYDNVWYYFNLKTPAGAQEFNTFVIEHESTKIFVNCRGYFNYRDPEQSTFGWITYEDGSLHSVRVTFYVKIVWENVEISPGEWELHRMLVAIDYKYNGVEDPRDGYLKADIDEPETDTAMADLFLTAADKCAAFSIAFASIGATFFVAALAYKFAQVLSLTAIAGVGMTVYQLLFILGGFCFLLALGFLLAWIILTAKAAWIIQNQ